MADTFLDPGQKLPSVALDISQELIDRYAEVSGDFNPVHVDVDGAATSEFGSTIAHGCIPMEPLFQGLSAALDRPDLPFSTQINLRYRRPSRPGDTIHLEASVAGIDAADAATVTFACVNQDGDVVLDGECLIPFANVTRPESK